jgi:hypothetical protein
MKLIYSLVIEICQPFYKFLKFYFFEAIIFFISVLNKNKQFIEKNYLLNKKFPFNLLNFLLGFIWYNLIFLVVLIMIIFWLLLPFLISWIIFFNE